jgi:hypothetical protein
VIDRAWLEAKNYDGAFIDWRLGRKTDDLAWRVYIVEGPHGAGCVDVCRCWKFELFARIVERELACIETTVKGVLGWHE